MRKQQNRSCYLSSRSRSRVFPQHGWISLWRSAALSELSAYTFPKCALRAAENSPPTGLARRLREAEGCAGLRRPGRGREAAGLLWRSGARLHARCSAQRGGRSAPPRMVTNFWLGVEGEGTFALCVRTRWTRHCLLPVSGLCCCLYVRPVCEFCIHCACKALK